MNRWLLLILLVGSVSALVILVEWWRERRMFAARDSALIEPDLLEQLPPRYQDGHIVSNTPMAAADIIWDQDGNAAWNDIWVNFCDLALAGGPPHRGSLLEPGTEADALANPEAYADVMEELARGLWMVTAWPPTRLVPAGWIGLVCPTIDSATWLKMAIDMENVAVRREDSVLLLPARSDFRVEHEIKNVITVVAKTHHYWTEHAMAAPLNRPVKRNAQ